MGFDVVDGFLDEFDSFRSHCDQIDYSGEVNPYDGVMYPGISFDIPESVKLEAFKKLGARDPKIFLRLTLDGQDVPHSAHNDAVMSSKGCIIYLNRAEDCKGGTSFVDHKDLGMRYGPANEQEEAVWKADNNNYDAWNICDMVEMVSNRALMFDTKMMHRAEPPSAFGGCSRHGRLVMVCFYD